MEKNRPVSLGCILLNPDSLILTTRQLPNVIQKDMKPIQNGSKFRMNLRRIFLDLLLIIFRQSRKDIVIKVVENDRKNHILPVKERHGTMHLRIFIGLDFDMLLKTRKIYNKAFNVLTSLAESED